MRETEPRTTTQKTSTLLMGPQQVRSAKTLQAKIVVIGIFVIIIIENK
jgi:hypothetical protein